jgi:hypothetical protein
MTRRVKGETPDLDTALKDMFASYYVTKNQVLAAFNLEHLKQAREFSLLHKRAENTKKLLKIVNYSEMDEEESSTDEEEESSTDEEEESSTDEDEDKDEDEESSTDEDKDKDKDEDEESSTDEDEEGDKVKSDDEENKSEEGEEDVKSDEEKNESDEEEVETEEEEETPQEVTTPTPEEVTTPTTEEVTTPTTEEVTTPTTEEMPMPEEVTTPTTEVTPTTEEVTTPTPEVTPTTEEMPPTPEVTPSIVEPSTVDSTGSIGPQSTESQSTGSQSTGSQSVGSQSVGNENENQNENQNEDEEKEQKGMTGGNTMEALRKYVGRVFTCLIIGLLEQGPDFFAEIWQVPKKSDTGAINAILTSLFLDCVGEHHAMVAQDLAQNTINLFLMPAQSIYVNQKNLCAIAAYVLAYACVQRKLLPQDMLQLEKSIQHMAIKEALEKILAPKLELPLFLNESATRKEEKQFAKVVAQDKANINVVTVQFLELLESKPMRMKDTELNMLNVPLKSAAPIRRSTRRKNVPAKKNQPKAKKNIKKK